MKGCTVSVIDADGQPHQVVVNAASLFGAVDQAIERWSRLSWFDAGAVAEVQAGNRRWRVAASACYFMARWNEHVGSVRLKLMHPTIRRWDCCALAVDLPGVNWASCLRLPLN
jgi:hypothetical protein